MKKFNIQVWNSEKKSNGGHVKQWWWGWISPKICHGRPREQDMSKESGSSSGTHMSHTKIKLRDQKKVSWPRRLSEPTFWGLNYSTTHLMRCLALDLIFVWLVLLLLLLFYYTWFFTVSHSIMIKYPPPKLDGTGFKLKLCYILDNLLCPSDFYALTCKMELKQYVFQRAAARI